MNSFLQTHSTDIIAIVNTLFAMIVLPMISAWLRNHLTEARAGRLETAMQAGLQSAISSATAGLKSRETLEAVFNNQTVRDAVVGEATNYVREVMPKTVHKLGVNESLEKIINSRVEEALEKLAGHYKAVNREIERPQIASSSSV